MVVGKEYPSSVLLKEKVLCPSCGARLALRTLKFKHICASVHRERRIEEKRARLIAQAEEAFRRRLESSG